MATDQTSKMKTFVVTVDFESQQFEVEAESVKQAESIVDKMYDDGDIYSEGFLIGHIEERG